MVPSPKRSYAVVPGPHQCEAGLLEADREVHTSGEVRNTDWVSIEFEGVTLDNFVYRPPLSEIGAAALISSSTEGSSQVSLSEDLAQCPDHLSWDPSPRVEDD